VYVPLLKLIELLLSDNSIRRETMTEPRVSVDSLMYNFCDGSMYSTILSFAEDKSALQLCCALQIMKRRASMQYFDFKWFNDVTRTFTYKFSDAVIT